MLAPLIAVRPKINEDYYLGSIQSGRVGSVHRRNDPYRMARAPYTEPYHHVFALLIVVIIML